MAQNLKAQRKSDIRLVRQEQDRKKQKRMRMLMGSIFAIFAILIVLAIIFKPKEGLVDIPYDKVPTMGNAEAKVQLAEFGDFQCPTCKRFSEDIVKKLETDYIDTGKVSFSFLNYTFIGEDSLTAALAALSVYNQNKDEYWPYYHAIYEAQGEENAKWATADKLVELAKTKGIKVDYDKLRQDIDNRTYLNEVEEQNALAGKSKITSTPTLLLNGEVLDFSTTMDYGKLEKEINKALAD